MIKLELYLLKLELYLLVFGIRIEHVANILSIVLVMQESVVVITSLVCMFTLHQSLEG
jgi:hypothetical protein